MQSLRVDLVEEVDERWREDAVCRGSEDLFFSQSPVDHRKAKAMCGRCPVVDSCFDYAMSNVTAGIYAGNTDSELRSKRKKLGFKPRKVDLL